MKVHFLLQFPLILYYLNEHIDLSILTKLVFFLPIYMCVCVFKHSLDHSAYTNSRPAFIVIFIYKHFSML